MAKSPIGGTTMRMAASASVSSRNGAMVVHVGRPGAARRRETGRPAARMAPIVLKGAERLLRLGPEAVHAGVLGSTDGDDEVGRYAEQEVGHLPALTGVDVVDVEVAGLNQPRVRGL